MLQIQFVGEIKTHISCSITFYLRKQAFYEIIWKKYGTAGQATDGSMIQPVVYPGGGVGVFKAPPENPKAFQNCAKLNPICENC